MLGPERAFKWLAPVWQSLGIRRGKVDGVDAAIATAHELSGRHGLYSGTKLAADLFEQYRLLDEEQLIAFFRRLVDEFGPDEATLSRYAQQYLEQPCELSANALHQASHPLRQEIIRRLNMVPGGTAMIVTMRERILDMMEEHPELAPLEADVRHLLSSWFNRGFLELRQIAWNSPASILQNIMRYESVHAITGWDDLQRRVSGNRLCFGFFHPALGDELLIFIEVLLTDHLSANIDILLSTDGSDSPAIKPSTAVFYSINNCQPGLRGIAFGNLLIKQLVVDLQRAYPSLRNFATLSPIPGFCRWLQNLPGDQIDFTDSMLDFLDAPSLAKLDSNHNLRRGLEQLCAVYLTGLQRTKGSSHLPDPVARFHVGNGAQIERINWQADGSQKGFRESFGLMVNYRYVAGQIETNQHRFGRTGEVPCSAQVSNLAEAGLNNHIVDD